MLLACSWIAQDFERLDSQRDFRMVARRFCFVGELAKQIFNTVQLVHWIRTEYFVIVHLAWGVDCHSAVCLISTRMERDSVAGTYLMASAMLSEAQKKVMKTLAWEGLTRLFPISAVSGFLNRYALS